VVFIFVASFLGAAHPLIEDRWDALVSSNRVTGVLATPLEELRRSVPGSALADAPALDAILAAARAYAREITNHLSIAADETVISPILEDYHVAAGSAGPEVSFDLVFPLPRGGPLRRLIFRQDSGSPSGAAPTDAWEAACWLTVIDDAGRRLGASMLPRGAPWMLDLASVRAAQSTTSRTFFALGVHHILSGWDHLLFLAAIAIGATCWRDFFILAALFTAAHSITVGATAAGIAAPADRWVDPFIAASIVFVAVENAVTPSRAGRRARRFAVFAFGLVHGLGFAGGLSGAATGVRGWHLAEGVAFFCLGVETGHLAVGLPLWLALRLAVRRATPQAAVRIPGIASWLVTAGGLWFLIESCRRLVK
jgi:HupE / UreJ protein